MPASAPQRSYLLIGAARARPIVGLVVLQVLFAFNRQREDIERNALSRAEQVTMQAMARVEGDFALMRVLATAEPIERENWLEAYSRAREVADLNPHWRNVILSDLEAGREVFSLRRPFGQRPGPINPAVAEAAGQTSPRVIGGAWREGPGCPCVYLHTPASTVSGRNYVLTVALDPAVFRSVLMRHVPSVRASIKARHSRDSGTTAPIINPVRAGPRTSPLRRA